MLVRERLDDLRTWLKRKLCRHPKPAVYEEVTTKADGRFRFSWSAFYACPDCGEVLGVNASFYGNPFDVGLAVEEWIADSGQPEKGETDE